MSLSFFSTILKAFYKHLHKDALRIFFVRLGQRARARAKRFRTIQTSLRPPIGIYVPMMQMLCNLRTITSIYHFLPVYAEFFI